MCGTTIHLRIQSKIFNKELSLKNPNPKVKVNVNMETREVTFFIEQEELKKFVLLQSKKIN